ncbi:MAG: nucleoside triphosphate pyrophosphohydrolase [Actinobacteria bacterium]|nr:MAG: nucleoside triphosphate pyrophosphohydrolase [Actinomycetota bacterium]
MTAAGEPAAALQRLDEITRLLRAECPWDREQDERTIVPHTVEEAYELADAANKGDDAKLLDELGDVLFQVHFLSLLLEERGAGDLAAVAEGCCAKLIRRHPHVFGDVEVEDAAAVLRNWDAIKREEEGRGGDVFADVPETLPSPLYARKLLRRAGSAGHEWPPEGALAQVREEVDRVAATADDGDRDARFDPMGDLMLAVVALARELRVDPELALRAAADRFRSRVDAGEIA